MSNSPERYDVIVIGAGQAGLAVGYHLARRGADFLIVDAAPEVGHSWRTRWDSLRLFTPAQYDSLPGMPFPAPADTHPRKDEVADYLSAYAQRYALPIRLNTPVVAVGPAAGGYEITTPTTTLTARQVVVATGPFQRPRVPGVAAELAGHLPQLHSAHYRNPTQLPAGGRVLVVGAANSGLQIAEELAGRHAVTVAVGATPPQVPQRVLGRDLFRWLVDLGVMTKPPTSRLARHMRAKGDLGIGTSTRTLRRRSVEFRPRLTGFAGTRATFADGTSTTVDAVVWATGYHRDYSWIHVPRAIDDAGEIRHDRGVTPAPGLYVIGQPWQTSRGSALLGFVGRDAGELDGHLAADAADTSERAETHLVPA
jgi:putative flavoprotein involved in K+ transport